MGERKINHPRGRVSAGSEGVQLRLRTASGSQPDGAAGLGPSFHGATATGTSFWIQLCAHPDVGGPSCAPTQMCGDPAVRPSCWVRIQPGVRPPWCAAGARWAHAQPGGRTSGWAHSWSGCTSGFGAPLGGRTRPDGCASGRSDIFHHPPGGVAGVRVPCGAAGASPWPSCPCPAPRSAAPAPAAAAPAWAGRGCGGRPGHRPVPTGPPLPPPAPPQTPPSHQGSGFSSLPRWAELVLWAPLLGAVKGQGAVISGHPTVPLGTPRGALCCFRRNFPHFTCPGCSSTEDFPGS